MSSCVRYSNGRRAGAALGVAAAVACLGGMGAAWAASGPNPEDYAKHDDANWILPAGSYTGNRQVNQNEITPANVDKLTAAWTFKIPDESPIETSPIVWDGSIYITSAHDDIYALDARTGKLMWQYKPQPKQVVGFSRNRGVAVMDGNVYVATLDGHIVALDAKTGNKVWDKLEVHDAQNSYYTMQPVPYKHALLLGVSNGDWGGRGNISAFDAKTGNRLWQWETVPGPGDAANKTWGGDAWKRGGASVWSGLAIDTATNTLYADTGNPQPDFFGSNRKGKNLYSDSMVALDISGAQPKLKWYYQFIAHDTHDWDPAMPPLLFTGKVGNRQMKLVAAGDKGGNFWILDATNGKLVHHLAVSYQLNQQTEPDMTGNVACPNTNGGVEYNGGAYDPATNSIFVPSIDQCGRWVKNAKAEYVPGQFYLGGKFPPLVGPNSGWFNAVDVDTGAFAWRKHLDLPANGGALVLTSNAGSVVLTGELNGQFDAFDTKTGKLLWHQQTGGSIIAPPSTYVMDGKRYVVVASGQPGFLKVPELDPNTPSSAMLTSFAEGSAPNVAAGGGNAPDHTTNGKTPQ